MLTPTRIKPLVDEAAFDARLSPHPNIVFTNATPDTLALNVDGGQLGRVLLNLFKNAREALEAEGAKVTAPTVSQSVIPGAQTITLSVTDNGPGLPPRARDKLFVAFEGSARAGGTGLGLAIAREIVQAHGGQLSLVDQPAGGRFDLVLPNGLLVKA
ncbi:MAG: ATP-binding protein [Candidatus Devosia euplotis]|nr:ATP-binding protein [Candidatus Devosia euplotis]